MIEFLETILIMSGIGRYIVDKLLLDLPSNRYYFNIAIAVFYMIFPLEYMTERFFVDNDGNEERSYSEAQVDFDTDYDRENPVTKSESINKYK